MESAPEEVDEIAAGENDGEEPPLPDELTGEIGDVLGEGRRQLLLRTQHLHLPLRRRRLRHGLGHWKFLTSRGGSPEQGSGGELVLKD